MAKNVGILGIEIAFPRVYVNQEELETFDKVSKGKYTIGLGQENMAFVQPCEDVNSLALTALHNLFEKYNISPRNIGRLEVGSETLLDKSKSTKTVLMQLFQGNYDVEGVTSVNACYGGTSALFSAFNWVESRNWDGRMAVVVCTDIAVYAKGPARPTGGAGAVAILIGPDAPLVAEPIRASFMSHAYDFYKPNSRSEYPIVDGQLSIKQYLDSIDICYKLLQDKLMRAYKENITTSNIDYFCFHSPFGKMVQKTFQRMVQIDMQTQDDVSKIANPLFKEKVGPSTLASRQLGNIYTGSLYAGLCSLIEQKDLNGKVIAMFSYGSGSTASLFLLRGKMSTRIMGEKLHLSERLQQRVRIDPEEYDKIMQERESKFGQLMAGNIPIDLNRIFPGQYVLKEIDDKWRRKYVRIEGQFLMANLTSTDNKNSNLEEQQQIKQFKQQENMNKVQEFKNQYNKLWSGFYKKTVQQRLDQLQTVQQVSVDNLKTGGINLQRADLMIENCIGIVGVPVGLALNFLINGKYINVPMATEEPSIVAGASSAAKLIAEGNGFESFSTRPIMIGQIQLVEVNDSERVRCLIDKHKKQLINYANEIAVNMVKRGGGVEDIRTRALNKNQISVDFLINVCDSMGANLVNTIVEHVAPLVEEITGCKIGLRVLSNLCLERRVSVQFKIPIQNMIWKGVSGEKVAKLILQAQDFAEADQNRAVTNNKGILNGVEAVALATGQDCRAINSSLHAYASLSGQYKPLATYSIEGENFIGKMTAPISVGTQGGAILSNPLYQTIMDILGQPDAQQLGEIMLCAGLASNLAALRALCVEGIQKGHMNLHARNVALASGVPGELVEEATRFMRNRGKIRKDTAEEFLKAYSIYKEIRKVDGLSHTPINVLCTFSGEFYFEGLNDRLDLHVVFNCGSEIPIHLSFTEKESQQGKELRHYIFGEKGYLWMNNWFSMLQELRLDLSIPGHLPTKAHTFKLKLLSILINLVSYNLLRRNFILTSTVINDTLQNGKFNHNILDSHCIELRYGLSLLNELLRIYKYNLDQSITNQNLHQLLWHQLVEILQGHIKTFTLWNEAKHGSFNIKEFLSARQKRLSFTMMILCDSLNLQQSQLNNDLLNQLHILGHVQEKESTTIRDANKWNQTSIVSEPNLYIYWLMQQNKLAIADDFELKQQFIKEIDSLMEIEIKEIESKLSPELKQLKLKATQVAKQYYLTEPATPKL